MNSRILCLTSVVFALFVTVAVAQPDARVLPAFQPVKDQPGGAKQPDKDKKPPEKKQPDPPVIDLTPPVRSSEFSRGYNPQMLGDIFGIFAMMRVQVTGTQTTTTQTTIFNNNPVPPVGGNTRTTTTTTTVTQTRTVMTPYIAHGPFKVAENASPLPVDRVFVTYNYFNSIRDPRTGSIGPSVVTTKATFNQPPGIGVPPAMTTVTTNTFLPGTPRVNANLHREVFGFEKTFLDGQASVELRVPFQQLQSNLDGLGSTNAGDLTIIGKYAFLLNRDTGKVLSGGLAVTAPTGPGIETIDGRIHSVLLQPWGGYVCPFDRFYLHGFHSVVIPTDSRDLTLLFNDVGVGYNLYRGEPGQRLRFIVPTAELHLTTPLTHRDGNGPFFVPDLLAATGGVHLGLGRGCILTLGASTPLTGPQTYSVEGFVQFNWRY